MQFKHRVHRARTAAATLVVTALAVLVMGCATAVAREPSGMETPAPNAAAGLLARGAGYDQVAGSQRVRALQSRLRRLSHDPGPIDGLFGPRTEAAVRGFQLSRRLPADGIVGRVTAAALGRASSAGPSPSRDGRRTTGASPARSRAPQTPVRSAMPTPAQPSRAEPESGAGSVTALLAALALVLGGLVALAVALRHRRRRPAEPASGSVAPAERARARLSRSARRRRTALVARLGSLRGRIGAIQPRAFRSRSGRLRRASSPMPDIAGQLSSRADPGSGRPVERRAVTRNGGSFEPRAENGGSSKPWTSNGGSSKRRTREAAPLQALGYLSADTPAELSAQAEQIEHLCERRGWTLVELVRASEANGHGNGAPRAALDHALERLRAGEATGLVVAQLEPISRAAGGLEALLERLDLVDARLVCLQPALDSRGGGPAPRERPPRGHDVRGSRPGEKVGLDWFFLGRIRGRSEAVWQYTAVDFASGYAWAELHLSERNARTKHLREFVQGVGRDLRDAGWRLESVVPENASGLGTRQVRGRDRPADGRREGGRATSNGHVERLQRRIVAECWRPALTRSREASLTALQRDLDDYLETYNSTETDGLGRGRVPEGALGNGARNGSSEHSTNGSGRIVGYERPRGRERAG